MAIFSWITVLISGLSRGVFVNGTFELLDKFKTLFTNFSVGHLLSLMFHALVLTYSASILILIAVAFLYFVRWAVTTFVGWLSDIPGRIHYRLHKKEIEEKRKKEEEEYLAPYKEKDDEINQIIEEGKKRGTYEDWKSLLQYFSGYTIYGDYKSVLSSNRAKGGFANYVAFWKTYEYVNYAPIEKLFEDPNTFSGLGYEKSFQEAIFKAARIVLEKKQKQERANNWSKIKSDSNYIQRPIETEKGAEGESNVEYILKWWAKTHNSLTIKKDCKSKYSDHCIRLNNAEEDVDTQEYDHILVTPAGVISIETKDYAGVIEVEDTNIWIRHQSKFTEGKRVQSPAAQVERHEYVLSSICENVPVYSLICIANEKTEIRNAKNSKYPVVSIVDLANTLESILDNAVGSELSSRDIFNTREFIEEHKVRTI